MYVSIFRPMIVDSSVLLYHNIFISHNHHTHNVMSIYISTSLHLQWYNTILATRYEQDANVRMQLGRRLEQILLDKEEAKDEIDELKGHIIRLEAQVCLSLSLSLSPSLSPSPTPGLGLSLSLSQSLSLSPSLSLRYLKGAIAMYCRCLVSFGLVH